MMQKEQYSLSSTPRRQLILIRGILAFLFFLGIAIILRQRLDPWLIPLVAIHEVLIVLFSSRVISQKMKIKREANPGLAKTGLIGEGVGLNFSMIIPVLVAIFILYKLSNPNTYQAGATWLLILSGISLAIKLALSKLNPGFMQYLLSIYLFFNVALWKFGIFHRKELVVFFAFEGILYLIISITHYQRYDPTKEYSRIEKIKVETL